MIQKIFEEDDLLPLRRESFNFISKFLDTCIPNTKLLEIGPGGILDSYTPYPEFDATTYIKQYCQRNNIVYKSCDILPGCDYTCSIERISNIITMFDYIIVNSVLEHVKQIWLVPNQLEKILSRRMLIITPFMFKLHGPNPDCWRISPEGYKELFSNFNYVNC